MNITRLELLAADLQAQRDFYAAVLRLPAKDRIWKPDSGVSAKLLTVKVHGMPYEIIPTMDH